jgi:hypothetical protein
MEHRPLVATLSYLAVETSTEDGTEIGERRDGEQKLLKQISIKSHHPKAENSGKCFSLLFHEKSNLKSRLQKRKKKNISPRIQKRRKEKLFKRWKSCFSFLI